MCADMGVVCPWGIRQRAAGVDNLTKTAAIEWAVSVVCSHAIAPGWIYVLVWILIKGFCRLFRPWLKKCR